MYSLIDVKKKVNPKFELQGFYKKKPPELTQVLQKVLRMRLASLFNKFSQVQIFWSSIIRIITPFRINCPCNYEIVHRTGRLSVMAFGGGGMFERFYSVICSLISPNPSFFLYTAKIKSAFTIRRYIWKEEF